ncbi:GIY-YIG nuclease family protein [Patescibacteria group bacterium]|nr:MAG: GIY-YIG nuclease family protein [Patescibacteria group bacterium]
MEVILYYIYSKKLNKYYLGKTNDLERRFIEHNNGEEIFTRTGIPWKLVGFIKASAKIISKLEYKLKKAKNPKYVYWYFNQHGTVLE